MDGEGIGREGVGKCVPIGEEERRDCEADTSEEREGRKGEGMWRWRLAGAERLRRVGA